MTTYTERDDSRYPRDFWLALGAGFLLFFGFHLLLAPLPLYVQDAGGSEAQIGLVIGAFALASVIARPAVGSGVDRYACFDIGIGLGSFGLGMVAGAQGCGSGCAGSCRGPRPGSDSVLGGKTCLGRLWMWIPVM